DALPILKDSAWPKVTQVQEACRFFGVANPESWERVWREPLARFRKSRPFKSDAGALATWLRLAELKGRSHSMRAIRCWQAQRSARAHSTTDPRSTRGF